jgi:hypothetical protein
MPVPGQQSLSNFYESVKFSSPRMATLMHGDIMIVAMHGLSAEKSEDAQEAADRLRRRAFDLPEIHRRVLENALTDLGYS